VGGISPALIRLKSLLSSIEKGLIALKIDPLVSTEKPAAGLGPEWQGAQRVSKIG
jgi:hypothetical protein